jgi:hypothetical protein
MKFKIIVLIVGLGLLVYALYFFSWASGFARGELEDAKTRKFELVPFHFSANEVDSIQLMEVEHPLLGGVISSNALQVEKYNDFIAFVDSSNPIGICKVHTCFIVKVKLKNGNITRYRTNGNVISGDKGDYFYRLKNNSILSFWGLTDTINCNKTIKPN